MCLQNNGDITSHYIGDNRTENTQTYVVDQLVRLTQFLRQVGTVRLAATSFGYTGRKCTRTGCVHVVMSLRGWTRLGPNANAKSICCQGVVDVILTTLCSGWVGLFYLFLAKSVIT